MTDSLYVAPVPSEEVGPVGLVGRLRADPLLRNSAAIMASTVVTSGLGYVFWLLVARLSGAAASGAGAAITSALQATVLLTSVGAASTMLEVLPTARSAAQWRRCVTGGLLIATSTALVGGVLAVLLLGPTTGVLPDLDHPVGATLFVVCSVLVAVGIVLDYVAVAERRGGVLLVRNVVMTGMRIPIILIPVTAVPLLAGLGGAVPILVSWTVAAALSLAITLPRFGFGREGHSLRPETDGLGLQLRSMAGSLIGQHLVTVTAMLCSYLLPILVVVRLSATDNAYFYITWMLGSVYFIIAPAVSTALFAEGAADPSQSAALVRRCLAIIGALLVIPMLVYLFGGGLLLSLFGPDYATEGRLLLVLLTLSAVPDAITNVAVAMLRATGRTSTALRLTTSIAVGCLIAAVVLLPHGIVMVGWCWLGAQTLGALWVLLRWRRIMTAEVTQ